MLLSAIGSLVKLSNISSNENNSINEAIERIDTAFQNMSKTFTDIQTSVPT